MTLTAMRDLLARDLIWCVSGRVEPHPGEDNHFELLAETKRVIVSVVTSSTNTPLRAYLSGGDEDGSGVWRIPSVGTEVLVCFSDGDFEGDCYLCATVGRGGVAVAEKTTLIIDERVDVFRIGGEPKPLPTMADYDELRAKYNSLVDLHDNHVHVAPSGGGSTSKTATKGTKCEAGAGTQVFRTE